MRGSREWNAAVREQQLGGDGFWLRFAVFQKAAAKMLGRGEEGWRCGVHWTCCCFGCGLMCLVVVYCVCAHPNRYFKPQQKTSHSPPSPIPLQPPHHAPTPKAHLRFPSREAGCHPAARPGPSPEQRVAARRVGGRAESSEAGPLGAVERVSALR